MTTPTTPEQAAFDATLEATAPELDAMAAEELALQAQRLEDPNIDEVW